ncbi:MAG: hypothetical protein WCN98_02825 [Verrucomicrobiaceae bacterium]
MTTDFLIQLRDAAPAIAMLVVMEGLLSVDNILAIASLASELPEGERKTALRLGLAGAYVFRGLALLFATFIMQSHTMLILGSAYLIHLMAEHFSVLKLDDDAASAPASPRAFWDTVIAIQFLDLSLSLDNVIVAVGVAPGQLWIVYTGVFLGLITIWLAATVSLKLVQKYPVLQHAAFLLIGFVGVALFIESITHTHLAKLHKFAGSIAIIVLCLWYERSKALQKKCQPVFRVLRAPLRIYAKTIHGIFLVVAWPFRRMASLMRKPH